MIRTWSATILLLAPAFVLLPGCRREAGRSDVVTLRTVVWGTAKNQKVWGENLAKFHKSNPNIRVRLEFTPWERTFDKLLISTAGGRAPDVTIVSSVWFVPCAAKGLLADLGPFVEKDKEFDIEDFYPAALNGWGKYGGKLYAIPAGIDIYAMYYNKTMFDKYGVPYPDETWDWHKYLWAAKKLTRDLDGDGRLDQWGTTQTMWQTYVWQNGGTILNEDQTKCTLNQPQAYEGLQFMADLRNRYHVAPTAADMADMLARDLFMNGKIGMYFSGSWEVPLHFEKAIRDFEYDVAPIPKGKCRAAFFGGASYAVLRGSEHKAEAWKLVKFMVRREALTQRAIKEQVVPSRISVAESKAFLHLEGPPKHRKVFLDAIEYGRTRPAVPCSREMDDIIRNEIDLVLRGKKTAKAACERVTPIVNDLLKYEISARARRRAAESRR